MRISEIPFGTTDWSTVEPTTHPGDSGEALWRTRQFGALRVRMVEYSPGYRADHWCEKGHRKFPLTPGVSYQVADGAEPRRSSTKAGATLFIVD